MSEREEYTLKLTRKEVDALITYLEQLSPITDEKTNLIVAKIISRLAENRARTILEREQS